VRVAGAEQAQRDADVEREQQHRAAEGSGARSQRAVSALMRTRFFDAVF
jgi:hypothetical protein